MTKEIFNNYDKQLHCLNCKRYVPKIHIEPRTVHQNGDIKKCNVCKWIDKHPDKMTFKDFTNDEIVEFLHFFLYEESVYLNDLADKLNRTIDEMVELFQYMKLGNKTCWIKTPCEYCGKEHLVKPQVYKERNYHYCSTECYYNDKSSKMPKGENNPFYKRIITNCTNCGKEIKVIPYSCNLENQYGDRHNFCSQECYWKYRSLYYIGDKTYNYQREFSEEEKQQHSISLLNRLKNENRLDTNIQLRVNNILDSLSVQYIREYVFDYYAVDNYLVDYNGVIEVMGDYWHTNPLRYNKDKYRINEMQQKQLHRDKIKASYITNHYNIPILYLWETDIKNNPEFCIALINLYIDNQRKLPNYHSFNWEFRNNELSLRNILITPYQDMSVNEYRYLIKSKVS